MTILGKLTKLLQTTFKYSTKPLFPYKLKLYNITVAYKFVCTSSSGLCLNSVDHTLITITIGTQWTVSLLSVIPSPLLLTLYTTGIDSWHWMVYAAHPYITGILNREGQLL